MLVCCTIVIKDKNIQVTNRILTRLLYYLSVGLKINVDILNRTDNRIMEDLLTGPNAVISNYLIHTVNRK